MSTIITITPNPCIDISTKVTAIIPEKKLHCTSIKKEPGGGGINVSRVIKRLGGQTTAVYMSGGYTGEYFTKMLHSENIDTIVIPIKDQTRENFVVADITTNLQYRFGMPGPVIEQSEWIQCLDKISMMENLEYIVASGSITKGIPNDFFGRIAIIAKEKNAKLIVDSSGEALKEALKEGVFMIKPNLGELSFLAGEPELNKYSAIEAARKLLKQKQCEIVVVSMGAAGALLVTNDISLHVIPPVVKIKSTVGAGDSMVAGIVFGLSNNYSLEKALQYGIACGSAATLNDGTALCSQEDVEKLFNLIRL